VTNIEMPKIMFNLLRHYAIASFVAVLSAAVLLCAAYRHLEVAEAGEFARKSNLTLTEAVLESLKPELGDYLESVAGLGREELSRAPFPPPLASAIAGLKKKASIARVAIYNNRGIVVFSTDRREIGSAGAGNAGFAAASRGEAASELAYRDWFSALGRRADGDNLVRTFVPVRFGPADPVMGALTTDVDLSAVVAQNEQETAQVVGGIVLILMLLYGALMVVVMRANKMIDAQQETIRERTAMLEALSAQLLAGEEAEKSGLATNLSEGLAQTLTAVKTRIEYSLERLPAIVTHDASLNTALRELQGAIGNVQEIATDLRPPSLDALGLLPTIRWLCRQFEMRHPGVRIEQQISVRENDIPEPLKIVIYRIIEAVLKDIGANPQQDRIRLSLLPDEKAILLAIDDIPQETMQAPVASGNESPDPRRRFAAAEERAMISGGVFSAALKGDGGVTLNASWATL
jgi:signal transduction histidine kinase